MYEGERLSMVFTTATGDLANRQAVVKTIARAAEAAGIDPTGLATHSGRRTVVTALYAHGGLDLADIARHVGHADTATTAEYVRSLGNRHATPPGEPPSSSTQQSTALTPESTQRAVNS